MCSSAAIRRAVGAATVFLTLSSQAGPGAAQDADRGAEVFVPEEIEILGACGLDLSRWVPVAPIPPAMAGGDFDGDGVLDHAGRVRERATGAEALAVCRAGTWLTLIAGEPLPPGLLPRIEAWRVLPADHGALGYAGEPPWPDAEGDIIVLERVEKSLHLLYRAAGEWRVQEVFRLVTGE